MDRVSARARRTALGSSHYGYLVMGWNAVLVPALIRPIEQSFHRSDAVFGVFYLVSALAYASAALGGGVLTEHIGRRPVLAGGALLLGGGLAGEARATTWLGFVLLAVPVGWGAGVIEAGMSGLVLDLYRDARGAALNLLHLFYSVGAFIAPLALGLLVAAGAPWRLLMLATAAGALALLGLLALVPMPSGRRASRSGRSAADLAPRGGALLPFAGLALGIGCYLAVEIGVSAWLVRLFAAVPLATATGILSGFWAGLMLGRWLAHRLAERVDDVLFTTGCLVLASLALLAAVLSPWVPVSAGFFALAGLLYGPVYPLIMAIGGRLYPQRVATVSGGLAAAAIVGSVVYPPLMGLAAGHIGLRGGMIGAALLGLPAALGVAGAAVLARRGARQAAAPPSRTPVHAR